ncbi:MAG: hypothetical protein ACK5JD_16855 [Mangrovibacterium sp.]
MAIHDAMKFIRESQQNGDLRKAVNQCKPAVLYSRLEELGYNFSLSEFEESVTMMHVKCQSAEEANRLMQTDMWFKLLQRVGE